MSEKWIKNEYGFIELLDKPTQKELDLYYSNKYYQEGLSSTYGLKYDNQESQYIFNKIHQKNLLIEEISLIKQGNFLDVGAGEGFALKYFFDLGWKVTGLDYSSFGVKLHNPKLEQFLIKGDIFNNLSKIIKNKEKFQLIWLDNVLEHVLDPYLLMVNLHKILDKNGVLVVEVPNDFSVIQKYLLSKSYIDNEFWICTPDHISYFCREGLTNLADASGWYANNFLSDFPIDLDLFSKNSNYIETPNLGRQSHLKRVEIENLLHSISPKKTNVLYQALSELDIGRNITGFFTKIN